MCAKERRQGFCGTGESRAAVLLDKVTKTFGSKRAVDALSLAVGCGELYVILGPNGAGKTTTLKLVAGLIRADSGSVTVLGRPVREWLEAGAVPFSFIPEEPFLYERLSAAEFIRFTGTLAGVADAGIRERFGRLAERLGLREFADSSALTYSHGMRQRTAIAAALVSEPQLLVVDEPMAGLDPQTTRALKDILRELVAAGRAVLLSTHTLPLAEEIADRIGIIHEGRLIAEGTAAELRAGAADFESAFLAITSGKRSP